MHLLAGQRERGVRPHEIAVEVFATVEMAESGPAVIPTEIGRGGQRIPIPAECGVDGLVDQAAGLLPPALLVFDRRVGRCRLGQQGVGRVVPGQLGIDHCDRFGEVACQGERAVGAQGGARLLEEVGKRVKLLVIPPAVVFRHQGIPGEEREDGRHDPDRRVREFELTPPDQLVGSGARRERDGAGQGALIGVARLESIRLVCKAPELLDATSEPVRGDVFPVFDLVEVTHPDEAMMVRRLAEPVVRVGEFGYRGHRGRR